MVSLGCRFGGFRGLTELRRWEAVSFESNNIVQSGEPTQGTKLKIASAHRGATEIMPAALRAFEKTILSPGFEHDTAEPVASWVADLSEPLGREFATETMLARSVIGDFCDRGELYAEARARAGPAASK